MKLLMHAEAVSAIPPFLGVLMLSMAALPPARAEAGTQAASPGVHNEAAKRGPLTRLDARRDPKLKDRFDALDSNHDGILDAAELAAANRSGTVNHRMEGKQ